MKKVSFTQIAEAAGVSVSTVSRVVNNAPGIAQRTREHVLGVMRELQYYPRQFAGGAHSRPSRLISLVITELDANIFQNPFFIMAIKGANACARERHYHVMVSFFRDGTEQYEYLQELVEANWTDGAVLFTVEREDPSIELLRDSDFPFSVIGRPGNYGDVLWTDNDNFKAMYQVVGDLVDHGYRRIAFIGGDWKKNYTLDRWEGYRQALRSRNIEAAPQLAPGPREDTERHGLNAEETGYRRMQQILEVEAPEAVVAADDFLAFGALQVLEEAGLHETALVGYNNSVRGRFQRPSLSSVDIHPEQLGYEAARLLIDSLQDGPPQPAHQIVDASVVHRQTSRFADA
jgi:DNA-binding LacI/PurR family transcriptional regulator